MMHKAWCSTGEVPYYFGGSSINFQGDTGWKIDNLNPIWVRLLGRSQQSNPSDLPCFNSSPPSAEYMHQWTGSSLVQPGEWWGWFYPSLVEKSTFYIKVNQEHMTMGVENHQLLDCFFLKLVWLTVNEHKSSTLLGLHEGNPLVTWGEFKGNQWIPTQWPHNVENVSMSWHYHVTFIVLVIGIQCSYCVSWCACTWHYGIISRHTVDIT